MPKRVRHRRRIPSRAGGAGGRGSSSGGRWSRRGRRARDRRRAARSMGSSSTRARRRPRTFPARAMRSSAATRSTEAGISPGVFKPFIVLTSEGTRAPRWPSASAASRDRRRDGAGQAGGRPRARARRGDPAAGRLEQGGARDDLDRVKDALPAGREPRRRRARGPRLRARRLRQLPVRPAVRRSC